MKPQTWEHKLQQLENECAALRSIIARERPQHDALKAEVAKLRAVAEMARDLENSTDGRGMLDLSVNDLRALYKAAREALGKAVQP